MRVDAFNDYMKYCMENCKEASIEGLIEFEKSNPKYKEHKLGYYWDGWSSNHKALNDCKAEEYEKELKEYQSSHSSK